jgi:flagellar biosynthesis protein FlhF
MQLQTFLADDMKAALSEVRAAMGEDAVIISSQKTKGGGVMIRAAVDEADNDVGEDAQEPANEDADAGQPNSRFRQALIRRLREPASDTTGRPGRLRFDRAQLLTLFARHRLPDGLAHLLAERAAGAKIADMTLALAAAIDASLKPAPIDFTKAKALMLIGLNGAGKTATVAKLAALAQLAGRIVMLIGTDTVGAGALARLEAFAEHLGAESVTAATATSLAERIRDCIVAGTLPIVDTAGFDPRQHKSAIAMRAVAAIENLETVGVVSATGDAEEAGEIAAGLADAGARRLIVTRADLSRRVGALICTALCEKGPFAGLTRSPFVAGGLEVPSALQLARLLIETDEESVQ